MPNRFDGDTAPPNPEQAHMEKTARDFSQQLASSSHEFQTESQSQGVIGKTFDLAKDKLGTSAKDHSFLHPAALWARLLNKDAASTTINNELTLEQQLVNKLAAAAQSNDTITFGNVYKELTGTAYDTTGTRPSELPAAELVKDYDDSQRNGVEFVADNAAMLTSALAFHYVPFGSTAKSLALAFGTSSLIGSATKASVDHLDGKYANFKEDLATGALDGIAVPIGEVGGGALSRYAGNKLGLSVSGGLLHGKIDTEGAGFITRALSTGLRAGAVNSVFNSMEYPTRDFLDHRREGKPIGTGQLFKDFALGTATGFAGGITFGAIAEGLHAPPKVIEQESVAHKDAV